MGKNHNCQTVQKGPRVARSVKEPSLRCEPHSLSGYLLGRTALLVQLPFLLSLTVRVGVRTPLMAPLPCMVICMLAFLLGSLSSLQMSTWKPRLFAFFCTASTCLWQDGSVKVSCWSAVVIELVPVSCLAPMLQVPSVFPVT